MTRIFAGEQIVYGFASEHMHSARVYRRGLGAADGNFEAVELGRCDDEAAEGSTATPMSDGADDALGLAVAAIRARAQPIEAAAASQRVDDA